MAALASVGAWTMLGAPQPQWLGWWQNTTLATHQFGGIVIGITAAAVAAWQAGRSRARGVETLEATAAVTGWGIAARSTVAIWILATAAYLITLSAASIRTSLVAPGSPVWPVVALTITLLAADIAVGTALGVWLPRAAAPVATVVLLYVGGASQFYIEGAEETWGRLHPVIQQSWDPLAHSDTAPLLRACLWLATLTCLALAAAGARRPWPRLGAARAATVVTVAGLSAALLLVPSAERGLAFSAPRAGTDPVTCAGRPDATVCVWADHTGMLAPMTSAFADLHDAAPGLDLLPTRLLEQGVPAEAGDVTWSVSHGPVPTRSEALQNALAAATPTPPDACYADGRQIMSTSADAVLPWVLAARLGVSMPPPRDTYRLERLQRLPLSQQDAWLNDAVRATSQCQEVPPLP